MTVFGSVRRSADESLLSDIGVIPVHMDVSDTHSIGAGRDVIERTLGGKPLTALVNNAGIPSAGPLELLPLEEFRRVLDVNVLGVFAVTQAFLPLLKLTRGRIVNISSVAGLASLPFMGPYTASKFALEAMSDSLRRELIPFGVKVIVIEPGNIQSRIWDKVEAMDLSRYRGTAYESALGRFRNRALRDGRQAPPAEVVGRVVRHALRARRPPLRRVISAHSFIDGLVVRMPDRLMDWLIGKMVWKTRDGG